VVSIVPQANSTSDIRTGNVVIGGKTIPVVQSGLQTDQCASLRFQRNGDQVNAPGLTGQTSFTVYAQDDCRWSAQALAPWIQVVAAGWGTGNGAVSYVVGPNPTGEDREGQIQVATSTFTVKQSKGDGTANGGEAGQGGGDSGGDGGDGGGDGGDGGGF
jgi:hypothetical protein